MKKLLFSISVILISVICKAQCPQTSCIDSLGYTITKDTLIAASGYTNLVWKLVYGPVTASLSGNTLIGMKPGTTAMLTLSANLGNMNTISTKIVTVAPAPIIPRTVIGFTYSSGVLHFTFNDGSIQ